MEQRFIAIEGSFIDEICGLAVIELLDFKSGCTCHKGEIYKEYWISWGN